MCFVFHDCSTDLRATLCYRFSTSSKSRNNGFNSFLKLHFNCSIRWINWNQKLKLKTIFLLLLTFRLCYTLWKRGEEKRFSCPPLFKVYKNFFVSVKFIYRTRAIIGRSWLEATLEYKPYIRPKVTVHEWSLEMGWKNIQAEAYNGLCTVCNFWKSLVP